MMELALDPTCLPHLSKPVVVGLSGGRDSVALLHLLVRQGFSVFACHVHHGIRGKEADEDEIFCQKLCEDLRVPFSCTHLDIPALAQEKGESLETTARLARRSHLASAAHRIGGRSVALAHHANDQAETVLFRLGRGSVGLRGMLPVHEAEGILWLRPLLRYTRDELTDWLTQHHITWREDATNAVPDVARNRIRLEVLPALSQALKRDVVPIINRSTRLYAESLSALEEALKLLESSYTDPQGRLFLPFLSEQVSSLRHAILHLYLSNHGVPNLSSEMIERVDRLACSKTPPPNFLSLGVFCLPCP